MSDRHVGLILFHSAWPSGRVEKRAALGWRTVLSHGIIFTRRVRDETSTEIGRSHGETMAKLSAGLSVQFPGMRPFACFK